VSFRIVIAEDEDITRKHLLYALKKEGYEVVGTKNGREALEEIGRGHFDVLITDVKMPEMSGIELLEEVKEKYPPMEVLVITGFGSIDSAVEAMKKGAYEYITKPFNLDELIMKVRNLHERKLLKSENVALKAFYGMDKGVSVIARSESMLDIMGIIENIRDSESAVLLTGESGTGKTLLAKTIHFTSRRRNMPFLSVNCGTHPEELLRAQLFGDEVCVQAAAPKGKKTLFEVADSGSLFLNEIDELPPSLQSRMLRVIEGGGLPQTDGNSPVRTNVRYIAAAGRDLKRLIKDGLFAEDLYYRLNVIEIFVPPLRERKEDIEPLSVYFLERHRANGRRAIRGFTQEVKDILGNYSFPGNVRELENIIERAVMLEKEELITPDSLPRSIKLFQIETYHPDRMVTLEELTKDYTEKVLGIVGGNKARAARVLGISEIDLWRILKEKRSDA